MAHAADLSNWGVPKLPLLKGVLHCDAVSKTSNASGVSINSSEKSGTIPTLGARQSKKMTLNN